MAADEGLEGLLGVRRQGSRERAVILAVGRGGQRVRLGRERAFALGFCCFFFGFAHGAGVGVTSRNGNFCTLRLQQAAY
jgi:hypothetical protein